MENNVDLEIKENDSKNDKKVHAENMRLKKEIKRLENEINQLKLFIGG